MALPIAAAPGLRASTLPPGAPEELEALPEPLVLEAPLELALVPELELAPEVVEEPLELVLPLELVEPELEPLVELAEPEELAELEVAPELVEPDPALPELDALEVEPASPEVEPSAPGPLEGENESGGVLTHPVVARPASNSARPASLGIVLPVPKASRPDPVAWE